MTAVSMPKLTHLLARWSPRYLLVSLFCFVANNLLLIALDHLGVPLWCMILISGSVMIPLGFALQALVTFSVPLNWASFGRYALVIAPNLPAAWALLWLVRDEAGLSMTMAAPAVTLLLFAWNAAGSVWAIYLRRPDQA